MERAVLCCLDRRSAMNEYIYTYIYIDRYTSVYLSKRCVQRAVLWQCYLDRRRAVDAELVVRDDRDRCGENDH